jgi:hypothetical protein
MLLIQTIIVALRFNIQVCRRICVILLGWGCPQARAKGMKKWRVESSGGGRSAKNLEIHLGSAQQI